MDAGSRSGRSPYSTRANERMIAGGNRYRRSGQASWIACAACAISSWIFLWKTRNRAGGDPSPRRSRSMTRRRTIPSWSPANALRHCPCRTAPMYTARAWARSEDGCEPRDRRDGDGEEEGEQVREVAEADVGRFDPHRLGEPQREYLHHRHGAQDRRLARMAPAQRDEAERRERQPEEEGSLDRGREQ